MGRPKKFSPSGDEPILPKRKGPPAKTSEGRENELIALAYDLVERRLIEGTATSQETTHFLRLGSTKERREALKLEKEIRLLDVKAEALESNKKQEELYMEAIKALRQYGGQEQHSDEDED